MGLFSTKVEFLAPMSGELIDITQVDDVTFAEKYLGDGVAIRPTNGNVVAPVDGKIIQVFHTKHALGIESKGVELLIHIGINTVELKGEGFEVYVEEGDKVKAGDLLVKVDLDLVREKGYQTDTAIVVTNMDDIKSINKKENGLVASGKDSIFEVKK